MSTDLPSRGELRASDADRDAVARRLAAALSEGRLDLDEYQGRLDSAMNAVTIGQLAPLTTDLPDPAAPEPADAPVDLARTGKANAPPSWWKRMDQWHSWSGAAGLMVAIWAVTGIAAGEAGFFWPVLPLGIWAAAILSSGGCRG